MNPAALPFTARPRGRERATRSAIADMGLDTTTMAGPLAVKLEAIAQAGFGQVMLKAADLVQHPGGWRGAVAEVRASGLAVTGFQVLRDFEGLRGHLHAAKVDQARAMIEMAHAVSAPVLLACSTTSAHASADAQHQADDLRKLAMLAVPAGLKVAFEALSWGRHVNEFSQAWALVQRADMPNLGLGLDAYHLLATRTPQDRLAQLDAQRIFLVQLADFMWQEVASPAERIDTARHHRVFPGEGVHSQAVAQLVRTLAAMGYRGDHSFEVFNDDCQNLPAATVAWRGRRAALWLAEAVLRRGAPPDRARLRSG